jgi:acetyl-CoA carboxylase carboxyltransferase component
MLIPLLSNSGATPNIGSIVGQAAGGGVAGAVLTAIVGAIKNRSAA